MKWFQSSVSKKVYLETIIVIYTNKNYLFFLGPHDPFGKLGTESGFKSRFSELYLEVIFRPY